MISEEAQQKLKKMPVVGFFMEKSFLHYVWTGGAWTILGIFLTWLFIDILKIPTILASTIVIGGTFILRYVAFRLLKIM